MKRLPISIIQLETLEFKNLELRNESNSVVLSDVNMVFPPNQVYWIRAYSGGGKSVLLKMLAGLIPPSRGEYQINGINIADLSFEEFRPLCLNLSYSFEYNGLISNRTLHENLMLPFYYHQNIPPEMAEAHVQEYCQIFHLTMSQDFRPAHVSGGIRKAACVARSLISEPQLLIMDNPTSGLDDKNLKSLIVSLKLHLEQKNLKYLFVVTEDEKFIQNFQYTIAGINEKKILLKEKTA